MRTSLIVTLAVVALFLCFGGNTATGSYFEFTIDVPDTSEVYGNAINGAYKYSFVPTAYASSGVTSSFGIGMYTGKDTPSITFSGVSSAPVRRYPNHAKLTEKTMYINTFMENPVPNYSATIPKTSGGFPFGFRFYAGDTITHPDFKQTTKPWGGAILGYGPKLVSRIGCNISSWCNMICKVLPGYCINPGQLNTILSQKNKSGNMIGYTRGNETIHGAVVGYINKQLEENDAAVRLRLYYNLGVKNFLLADHAGMCSVKNNKHWVTPYMYTGKSGNIRIKDPSNLHDVLQEYYGVSTSTTRSIVTVPVLVSPLGFRVTDPPEEDIQQDTPKVDTGNGGVHISCEDTSVQIELYRGAELVFASEQRITEDMETGEDFLHGAVLETDGLLPGTYTVKVIGQANTDYTLDIRYMDFWSIEKDSEVVTVRTDSSGVAERQIAHSAAVEVSGVPAALVDLPEGLLLHYMIYL